MGLAAVVVSIIAAGISGWVLWFARGQRDAARDAATEASRSATAAERTVAEARRSVDAAEGSLQLAEIEATKYTPPWELQWATGDTYQLVNAGDETTHDVTLGLADIQIARGELHHLSIGARSAVKFMAANTMGTRDDTVTVTWSREPGGVQQEWRHPMVWRLRH